MPLLAATGLTKSYGGVRVLDAVDFDVEGGEIHALVGENGAGKSTLIKILGGAVRAESGRVELDAAPLPAGDPLAVRRRGLSIVYSSHRFEEVFALANRVTVLRDGRRVATEPIAGLDRRQVIRWMVGRDVSEEFPPRQVAPGKTILEIKDLSAPRRFQRVS